mmetsp:Transcript_42230/g.98557  ORF Transcript_42230/g.98557 Transcript_42230/m.98557 type:complete len:231 (+) Transcript_42230:24-716(+)
MAEPTRVLLPEFVHQASKNVILTIFSESLGQLECVLSQLKVVLRRHNVKVWWDHPKPPMHVQRSGRLGNGKLVPHPLLLLFHNDVHVALVDIILRPLHLPGYVNPGVTKGGIITVWPCQLSELLVFFLCPRLAFVLQGLARKALVELIGRHTRPKAVVEQRDVLVQAPSLVGRYVWNSHDVPGRHGDEVSPVLKQICNIFCAIAELHALQEMEHIPSFGWRESVLSPYLP